MSRPNGLDFKYISVDQETWNLQFYKFLMQARDFHSFIKAISAVLEKVGFTDFSCSRISPAGNLDAGAELITMPEQILKTYHEEAFYQHDMILDIIKVKDVNPIFQSLIRRELERTFLETLTTKRNWEILRLNEEFGYQDYYLIPQPASTGEGKMLFSVTARDADEKKFQRHVNQHRQFLHLLSEAIDFIATQKFPSEFLVPGSQKVNIAPRSLQLLKLLAQQGLSLKEAAEQMHISESRIKQHSSAIKAAFGANSLPHATYLAFKANIINVDE